MRVGIMQPYFMPYLEHFRLMAACDRWIVFDTVPYRRKTWMTRNRILNLDKGWSWLSVPVSPSSRDQPVAEVPIAHHLPWRSGIEDRLAVYRTHAPHYGATLDLVDSIIGHDHQTITDLNVAGLTGISRALGIGTPIDRLSRLDLELPPDPGPGEWALYIAAALGAEEYRNPSGGRHLFDAERFEAQGIRLTFHEHQPLAYDTGPFAFVPDLSVIDPLMWLGLDETGALV